VTDPIQEGLDDYADERADEAAQQAQEAAENREIMEDIAWLEYDMHLRTLGDQELIGLLCNGEGGVRLQRISAEFQRRIDMTECEWDSEYY
jgi:hypothetical protein